MSVISQLRNIAVSLRVRPVERAPEPLQRFTVVDYQSNSDLRAARRSLLRVQQALETIGTLMTGSARFKLDLPDAVSVEPLGLDLTHTATTLSSAAEINASPMSFTPFGPEWIGGSTAAITIGGEYDGVDASGALSFEVVRPGTKGIDNLRIRVENAAGDRFNFNIQSSNAPDTRYDLRNGLFLTLGEGNLLDEDTTSIQLFDAVGADFDPDKPLGGVRNDNPNFQYYPSPDTLPAVVDGSFELNGEVITVNATDTLNDVVARINLSAAGVTAAFNPATERVEFIQNTLGSAAGVDIQADTSNLIRSAKLDSAIAVPGIDPETIQAFADVASLSSVLSGNILINGTPIAVDATSDSLTDVLAGINASAAGVTASFDELTQRVRIEANDGESSLEIDSNGTGLFSALYLPEGRVDPEVREGGISRRRSYQIADAFEDLATELNVLFDDRNFTAASAKRSLFRDPLDAVLNEAFGDMQSVFGLSLDRSANALRRGDLLSIDRRQLTESLQLRGNKVQAFFADSRSSGTGVIAELFNATAHALERLGLGHGRTGGFVDTFA
jgi:flagellar capping protein FliD